MSLDYTVRMTCSAREPKQSDAMNPALSPERFDALQQGWVRLLAEWGCSPVQAYPVFDQLAAAYSEPHRHYHTLEHLYEMFRVVGRLSTSLTDPHAVRLAVWFHDAVYDPHSHDNEARSVELLHASLSPLGVPSATRDQAARLIQQTTHQHAPITPEAVALLDADLAILAAPEPRYTRYAAAIRQEYGHLDDSTYRAGRLRVLEAFLARPQIFHHPHLVAEGEAPARQNLTTERDTLLAHG